MLTHAAPKCAPKSGATKEYVIALLEGVRFIAVVVASAAAESVSVIRRQHDGNSLRLSSGMV